MTFSKQKLRLRSSERLGAISKTEYQSKSLKVSENALTLLNNLRNSHKIKLSSLELVLGVFAPLSDEPCWPVAFENCSFALAFPKTGNSGRGLSFVEAKYEELGITKEFGVEIMTPACLPSREEVEPDCLLIPGLAFSRTGERLGRGKGFYDRYLENFKGIKIGICFDEILEQEIIQDNHDELMDYIVTDLEILEIKSYKKRLE